MIKADLISEAMKELARRGVLKRHKGKTKKQIAQYYSDLRRGKCRKTAVQN